MRVGDPGARGGQDRDRQLAELGLPLEELVLRGTRDTLQRVIEGGPRMVDELAAVSLTDGRWRATAICRRAILTTVGPLDSSIVLHIANKKAPTVFR